MEEDQIMNDEEMGYIKKQNSGSTDHDDRHSISHTRKSLSNNDNETNDGDEDEESESESESEVESKKASMKGHFGMTDEEWDALPAVEKDRRKSQIESKLIGLYYYYI